VPRRADPQDTVDSNLAANESREATLRRRVAQWQSVHRMADAINRAESLESIYAATLDGLQNAIGVQRASILLFDPDGVMRFKAWRGLSEGYRQAVEGHTPWIPGQQDARPITVPDIGTDVALEAHRATILAEGIRALAFIPLSSHGRVIGKFMLYYSEPRQLAADELELAETIARYVGNALERRRTEVALEESEEEFRAIFELAGSGAALVEAATGRFLRVNPRFCEMLGYSAAELYQRTFEEVSHPEDHREGAPQRRTLMRGEIPVYNAEARLLRKDGSAVWGEVIATISRDAEGRPVRVLAVVQDISERKGAEQALRTSEARWRQLAQLGSVLASSLELERTLESVTRLALPLFGDFSVIHLASEQGELRLGAAAHVDPRHEQLLRELAAAYHPETNPRSYLLRVFRDREPVVVDDLQEALGRTAGSELAALAERVRGLAPTSLIASPLIARGRALGTLVLGTGAESGHRLGIADLPIAQELARRAALALDNVRLYDQLRETDRRKDEFLAMLAHELRNPLAAIVNAGELLRLRADDEAVRGLATEMVARQARHMARLVDDLLDVSRITRGAIPLLRQPLELGQLLREAVEGTRSRLDQRQQQLSIALPSEPVWVEGDEARLEQVISNLLSNSSKFTPDGGTITVELEADATEATLRVRDAGAGISPEFLPRVFDLFAQEDRSLARSEGGLGIGLTLTRTLVEQHGGRIAAASEGPGKGSVFTVRLPRTAGAATSTTEGMDSDTAETPAAPLRVLVVEDSADTAKALAELLRIWRHEVVSVPDARAALTAFKHFRPHVVLIDIGLPDFDGYELASRLQRNFPGERPHLIALTGYGHEADRQRSREVGIAHHLVKPVDPPVLADLLARAPRDHASDR
jgi:PAS domain S-box-containing protein